MWRFAVHNQTQAVAQLDRAFDGPEYFVRKLTMRSSGLGELLWLASLPSEGAPVLFSLTTTGILPPAIFFVPAAADEEVEVGGFGIEVGMALPPPRDDPLVTLPAPIPLIRLEVFKGMPVPEMFLGGEGPRMLVGMPEGGGVVPRPIPDGPKVRTGELRRGMDVVTVEGAGLDTGGAALDTAVL